MNVFFFVLVLVVLVTLLVIPLVRRRWKERANDVISILITVLGTFLGFTGAIVVSDWQSDIDQRHRLLGLLKAAEQSSAVALQDSREACDILEDLGGSFSGEDFAKYHTAVAQLDPPDVLKPLMVDGELFLRLSSSLQQALPRFVGVQERRSGLVQRGEAVESLEKVVPLDLAVQDSCLLLEVAFQEGRLSGDALSARMQRLVSRWTQERILSEADKVFPGVVVHF
jgi:hypothetical protein